MQIVKYIKEGSPSERLLRINSLLDNAKCEVTFWGRRIVSNPGYEGSISLEKLARRVLRASQDLMKADNLTAKERIVGIEVTRKIGSFYEVTDTAISKRNWFTRLLRFLREFSFYPYTTRFYVENVMKENFCSYSEEKFLQNFGGEKNSEGVYNNAVGSFSPNRLVASEQMIRGRVNGLGVNSRSG